MANVVHSAFRCGMVNVCPLPTPRGYCMASKKHNNRHRRVPRKHSSKREPADPAALPLLGRVEWLFHQANCNARQQRLCFLRDIHASSTAVLQDRLERAPPPQAPHRMCKVDHMAYGVHNGHGAANDGHHHVETDAVVERDQLVHKGVPAPPHTEAKR